MLDSLKLIFQRLLEDLKLRHYRFLYEQFNLDNRLTGLVGARGVGKTTLMLQYIKNKLLPAQANVFYFSADHIYFNSTTIYAFIENLFLTEGTDIFFIDEIHKYKNWDQELKNLYDGFPALKIVFSGSSSLDLVRGGYDLSRRAKFYHLPGLSFREYLNFETDSTYQPIPFMGLITETKKQDLILASAPKIKGYFQKYLQQGFYPFYAENPLSYYEKILQIIDKTIYEDIANFYNLKTINLQHFRKLLNFLVSIPPGSCSVHNLAKNLSIDDKTASNYLMNLDETGLVKLIYPQEGGNVGLRRPEKIFLDNTNLQYALEGRLGVTIELGAVRELFFIQMVKNAGMEVFHNKKGDYQIQKYLFEIGGKNKTRAQLKGESDTFLVKDDILVSQRGEIPLMYFGFLY